MANLRSCFSILPLVHCLKQTSPVLVMIQENTSEIFRQLVQRFPAELKRIETEDVKGLPDVSTLEKVKTIFDTTVPWEGQLDNLVRHSAACVKTYRSHHVGRQTHFTWVSTSHGEQGVFEIWLMQQLD